MRMRLGLEDIRNLILVVVVAAQVSVAARDGGFGYRQQLEISDTHVALFVFGDSLYDVGMNAIYKKGTLAWNAPYGETYFKNATGRYCDGRLIPDYIAQYANLPLIDPYLMSGLINFTNGVNFAAAGACVRSNIRPSNINLNKQVGYFGEMVEKLKKEIGENDTSKLLKQAVYLFSIGGNDYAQLVSDTITNQSVLTSSYIADYSSLVIGNLSSYIQAIYNYGGRKMAFQNVAPIGCLPSTKKVYSDAKVKFNGTCAEFPQTLAQTHNSQFLILAQNLQTNLSDFNYTVYDSYTQTQTRVTNNTEYGFTESETACCGTGAYHGAFTCGSTTVNFSLCSNPNVSLWFDAAHPTETANAQFSKLFWTGSSDVVYPYPLKDFFTI